MQFFISLILRDTKITTKNIRNIVLILTEKLPSNHQVKCFEINCFFKTRHNTISITDFEWKFWFDNNKSCTKKFSSKLTLSLI